MQSADAGYLTNNEIAKNLKEINCKVVLVGDGSDEIFGGYSWFGLSKFPFNLLGTSIKNLIYFYAISRSIKLINNTNIIKQFSNNINNFKGSYFDKVCQNELFNQLPNNYLMKVDKPFMRNGIESRVPYLDHKLVEKVFNLEEKLKLSGKTYSLSSFQKSNEKYTLRKIAKKYFNNNIHNTKKRGFSISTYSLIKDNRDIFYDVLSSKHSIFLNENKKKILSYIDKIKDSKYHPIHKFREILVWKFFLLNVWRKNVS